MVVVVLYIVQTVVNIESPIAGAKCNESGQLRKRWNWTDKPSLKILRSYKTARWMTRNEQWKINSIVRKLCQIQNVLQLSKNMTDWAETWRA